MDSAKDLPVNSYIRNKCKFSVNNCRFKKLKRHGAIEDNSDVEFVSVELNKNMMFSPICAHV